jgi:hypothetical protein
MSGEGGWVGELIDSTRGVAGADSRTEFSPISNSGISNIGPENAPASACGRAWIEGESVPWDAWLEIERRALAAGYGGQVATASVAERLYPRAEYLRDRGATESR